jgi:hypothetical protein
VIKKRLFFVGAFLGGFIGLLGFRFLRFLEIMSALSPHIIPPPDIIMIQSPTPSGCACSGS